MKKVPRYLLALVLALINDASDVLAILQPFETIIDIVTALAIIALLRDRLGFRQLVIMLLDLVPFFDFIPLWSMYVGYIIARDREFWEELVGIIVK